MDRSMSLSSVRNQQTSSTLPPWERQHIAQVPFMGHTSGASGRRPRLDSSRNGSGSDFSCTVSPVETSNPWNRPVPHSSLTMPSQLAPYHTPASIPPAPRTSSYPVPQVNPRAPPTPPDSLSNSSDFSSTASPPLPAAPAVTAFPGTMSTRTREGTRSRSKASRRTQASRGDDKAESGKPLGTRFKSAFKDMFKRNPVDESSFERIEDRHWTDDY